LAGRSLEPNGIRVYAVPAQGPELRTGGDAVDRMSAASEFRAAWIAIPVERLGDDFLELRTRVAGEMAQKFNPGLKVETGGTRPPAMFMQKQPSAVGTGGTQDRIGSEGVMIARLLMVLSASILLTLGVMHLATTFWGTGLAPRDPSVQVSMSRTSPGLTGETTMWRCWMGFNTKHSMALILFGLIYGYLALAHDRLLFRSPFLLLVGLAMLACLIVVCKLYFFRAPLIGVSISLAFYVASIALSRV
jgi:hypothetical protein